MAAIKQFQPTLVVVDTNVLIHLAQDHCGSHNTIRRCVKLGWFPVVTQTIVQELGHIAMFDENEFKRVSATKALQCMREWGIEPTGIKPVGNGICDIVADAIAGRNLLPADQRNDAYILVESGIIGATKLISWDGHFLKADSHAVQTLLKDFHLYPVQITSPDLILGIGG